MLYSLAVLLLLQFLGEWIRQALGIPVPGPLIGMALMLVALCLLGRLPRALRHTSNGLLSHLMLLFIPSVVAIMTQTDRIAAEWLPFIAACILATAITTVVTAATLKFMLRRQQDRS